MSEIDVQPFYELRDRARDWARQNNIESKAFGWYVYEYCLHLEKQNATLRQLISAQDTAMKDTLRLKATGDEPIEVVNSGVEDWISKENDG